MFLGKLTKKASEMGFPTLYFCSQILVVRLWRQVTGPLSVMVADSGTIFRRHHQGFVRALCQHRHWATVTTTTRRMARRRVSSRGANFGPRRD